MSVPYPGKSRYLRRAAVLSWLGIDRRLFTKLVDAGAIQTFYFHGDGRAYYSRAQILRAERAGKILIKKGVRMEGVRSQEKKHSGSSTSFIS